MIEAIKAEKDVERALRADAAVIYKYGQACAVSAVANTQIERFAAEHPNTPVYRLDVVAQHRLAMEIAKRLDVEHRSPQVILVRAGGAVWAASHYAIRATRLANALEETA